MTNTFTAKYKLLQKIGEGSFSEVVKCEDKQSGIMFAAKRLKKIFAKKEEVMKSAEIIAMKKLSWHPNVLHMLEFHYDHLQGKAIFIFELMDMSLYDLMKAKSIPELKAKNYLFQILKGLDHLHQNGLFHRDVKPENVLIKLSSAPLDKTQTREIVKLADLGSIRGIYSTPPYTEYISTRWYRSPECLLTVGQYGPKMDVWATGCVFYEVLTSRPLFPGTNEIDQLSKIHSVLGSPGPRLLNKLKNKSRNCENFPKTPGTGIYKLACHVSETCRTILKLMIQYDPDQRINVRRLLQHRYFDDIREKENEDKKMTMVCKPRRVGFISNRGDYGTAPELFSSVSPPTAKSHSSSSNKGAPSSPSDVKRTFKPSSTIRSSKTSVHLSADEFSPLLPKHRRLGVSRPTPLVDQHEMKLWGINPNMLKPRRGAPLNTRPGFKRRIGPARPDDAPSKDQFRKTTSNLPQEFLPGEPDVSQLKSKSFVLPWRKAGSTALKVNENLTLFEEPEKLRRIEK